MKKKIIIDFDNSFTVDGKDIDDLIALLYLLSCDNVEVLFVTTTFGNTTLQKVNESTKKSFAIFDINIPFYSGNELGVNPNEKQNLACEKMKKYIEAYPNQISILALGALKNLADLQICYSETVKKIKEFSLMGGITSPLYFNKKQMQELNFASDAKSTQIVLQNFPTPNIITGNNCIEHIQYLEDIEYLIYKPIIKKLYPAIKKWLDSFKNKYAYTGVVLWDVIAAMFVSQPELFVNNFEKYELGLEQLKIGKLEKNNSGYKLNLPTLKKDKDLYKNIFEQISKLGYGFS